MTDHHRLAAVAAAVVAAHAAVLLGALTGLPQRAQTHAAAAPRPAPAFTVRIHWQAPAALPERPATLPRLPSNLPPVAQPAVVAASVPMAELRAFVPSGAPALVAESSEPPAPPVPPVPIAGVALPAQLGLFGGAAAAGFSGGRGPTRPPAPLPVAGSATPAPDPAVFAWRAQLVAALMQQLPDEHPATAADTRIDAAAHGAAAHLRGHCVADGPPPRLRCDHPEAEATLGEEANHAIAVLLHRLAALDRRPSPSAVAYAAGRFRVEWR